MVFSITFGRTTVRGMKQVLDSKQEFLEHVLRTRYYAWCFHIYHLLESSKLSNALTFIRGDD